MNISTTNSNRHNPFVKVSCDTNKNSFEILNDENQIPETNLSQQKQKTMIQGPLLNLLPPQQTVNKHMRTMSNDVLQHRINQEIKRRRVLQALDSNSNQRAPSLMQLNPNHKSGTIPLRFLPPVNGLQKPKSSVVGTGIKRKYKKGDKKSLEEEEELAERENTAWLDMLLYLVERKYGKYTLPIPVEDLMQQDSSNQKEEQNKIQVQDEKEREKKRKLALQRHAQQIHDTSTPSSSSCGCKTGCLKMYCVCFSTRGFCHPDCLCDDCKNTQNSETRLTAIQTYLENDPRAFANAGKISSSRSNGFLLLLPEKSSTVGLRGCRCKKSKCSKKYCECYQNGLQCSSLCRCVDCSNHTHSHDHNKQSSKDGASVTRPSSIINRTEMNDGSFHTIELTVTKKPRRNETRRSFQLML